ncbi:MAG: SH3 domain-containing protein [Devosia sp.]
MAHLLFAIPYRHVVFRAAAGVLALFIFFAIVTGVLPVGCLVSGGTACARTTVVATPAAQPRIEVASVPTGLVKVATVTIEPPKSQLPTIGHNELIAQTFSALKFDLAPVEDKGGSLTARRVQTVAIRADGQPEVTAMALAETPAAPPTPPAVEAATTIADGGTEAQLPRIKIAGADAFAEADAAAAKLVADAMPEETTPVAKAKAVAPKAVAAKTSGSSAVVTGNGANARSKPSKSAGVAFALAGGTRVTVIDDTHGWLQVRDAKGRVGWMYKDYLDRG